VLAKLRARLAVSVNIKRAAAMESFDIAKLQVVALRSRYQIELKNRFQALARENPSPEINDEPDLVLEKY